MNFRGASVSPSRVKSQSRTFLSQRWPPCCHVGRHSGLISRVPRPWSAVIHRWIVSRDADCLHRVSSSPFLFHGIEGSGFWNFPSIFGIGHENEGKIDGWAMFSIVWSFGWFSFSRARWNSIRASFFSYR